MISNFIWDGRRPRVRLSTLQQPKLLGGLAVPNFDFYYWSFQIRALSKWVDPQSTTAWRMIESAKVLPHRLQDILFSSVTNKTIKNNFGPIIANSIHVWKKAERWMGGPFKFCQNMPLWYNPGLLCGSKPFIQPSWSSLGVNTLGDIYDTQGLCSIQDLRTRISLAASSYFVYFQLRSALKAYGVPWNSPLPSHPMLQWIAPLLGRSSVSVIYSKLLEHSAKALPIELGSLDIDLDWERIWGNLSMTSKNLTHQLIHFKTIHRAYITPYKRFQMKLQTTKNCHICNTASPGTFLHMFWDCPVISRFWSHVNSVFYRHT